MWRLRCVLSGGGGFVFKPLSDMADVAAEDGGGLLHIAPQQQHDGAHSGHRQYEIRQRHFSQTRLIPLKIAITQRESDTINRFDF